MKRIYPDHPVVSVSAAIFDSEPADNMSQRVLLIQRGKEPKKGFWSLPGGAVELGETVKDAIMREIEEECGIDIEPLGPVEVRDSIVRDENDAIKFHYVLISYLARRISGEPRVCDEVSAVEWVPLSEISRYRSTDGLEEIVQKASQLLIRLHT